MRESSCLLCGSLLVHLAEAYEHPCTLCGGSFAAHQVCKHGHTICDACHAAPADELIEKTCLHSTSTQPVELAVSLLNILSISMLGPVNRYLVPAVLLAAYYNQLGNGQVKARKLEVARQRAAEVVGDFCGIYGVCVTGIGTGIFISLIDEASPDSEGAWGLANQMTNESLRCIDALGELRCCKRDTLMAIKTARSFVRQNLHIELDVPDRITCELRFYSQDCLKKNCPFRPHEN